MTRHCIILVGLVPDLVYSRGTHTISPWQFLCFLSFLGQTDAGTRKKVHCASTLEPSGYGSYSRITRTPIVEEGLRVS